MQSPIRHRWFVLCGSVALWVTGCVGDNADCGGPTSDWPFCGGGRGGQPTLLPDMADQGGDAGLADGGSTGGSTGVLTPTTGGSGAADGGVTGGSSPTGGGSPSDGMCLLCPGGGAGASLDGVPEPEAGCGLPLPCALEVELEAGDQKSLGGDPPLDFTQASVAWQSEDPQFVDVYLRAQDPTGHEVRVAVRFEGDALTVGDGGSAGRPVEAVDCGGDPVEPLEARLALDGLGWDVGFHGVITLQGEGWMTEIDLTAAGICRPL